MQFGTSIFGTGSKINLQEDTNGGFKLFGAYSLKYSSTSSEKRIFSLRLNKPLQRFEKMTYSSFASLSAFLTRAFFVKEDENGEIDMPGGRRYSYSESQTRQIYLQFMFDFGEGLSSSIREVGVFMDSVPKSGLPETQTYFTPEEIQEQGTLILIENLETPDTFTPNKKGSYGTILTL